MRTLRRANALVAVDPSVIAAISTTTATMGIDTSVGRRRTSPSVARVLPSSIWVVNSPGLVESSGIRPTKNTTVPMTEPTNAANPVSHAAIRVVSLGVAPAMRNIARRRSRAGAPTRVQSPTNTRTGTDSISIEIITPGRRPGWSSTSSSYGPSPSEMNATAAPASRMMVAAAAPTAVSAMRRRSERPPDAARRRSAETAGPSASLGEAATGVEEIVAVMTRSIRAFRRGRRSRDRHRPRPSLRG